MRKPVVMLSNTDRQWEVVGARVRADGYFGSTDGIHTISVHYTNLKGGFKIQGTLSLDPSEDDWFDIQLNGSACPAGSSYVEYPRDPYAATGPSGGDTGVDAFTFVGNFTYLRAILTRSYLGDTPPNNVALQTYGEIDRVLLSL